jgi:hypothetical protein
MVSPACERISPRRGGRAKEVRTELGVVDKGAEDEDADGEADAGADEDVLGIVVGPDDGVAEDGADLPGRDERDASAKGNGRTGFSAAKVMGSAKTVAASSGWPRYWLSFCGRIRGSIGGERDATSHRGARSARSRRRWRCRCQPRGTTHRLGPSQVIVEATYVDCQEGGGHDGDLLVLDGGLDAGFCKDHVGTVVSVST